MASWPFQRRTAGKNADPTRPPATQGIDLRQLVVGLELQGPCLQFALAPHHDAWARPGEVLALLGLDERVDLAEVVRTEVDYGLPNEPGKG
jgi:hypothetical protein